MFGITIGELLYRRRQFLIVTGGAGLVFAMTLLLAGLTNSFGVEIDQTVSGFHADTWVVKAGSSGRIASLTPFAQSDTARTAAVAGVRSATPVVVIPQTADVAGTLSQVNLVGSPIGSAPGRQPLTSGAPVTGRDQAVVDQRLGADVGAQVAIGGRNFRVVDITSARVPAGLATFSNAGIEAASLDQMSTAVSSTNNSELFMWVIAAVIVASLVYVTALERTRDFAVLKALGASSGRLHPGLAFQAELVALVAALIAVVLAQFMTGVFRQPIDFPASAYVALPLSAIAVGLLAGLIALRRAVGADPAKAFAG